jgi:SOS response regulatory protein OraA/RecX
MSIFEYDEEREIELIRQAEFEKGEAYGKAEGKADIVLNMHRKNYSPKEISEIIDMNEEEVRAIIYNQEPVLV